MVWLNVSIITPPQFRLRLLRYAPIAGGLPGPCQAADPQTFFFASISMVNIHPAGLKRDLEIRISHGFCRDNIYRTREQRLQFLFKIEVPVEQATTLAAEFHQYIDIAAFVERVFRDRAEKVHSHAGAGLG